MISERPAMRRYAQNEIFIATSLGELRIRLSRQDHDLMSCGNKSRAKCLANEARAARDENSHRD